MAFVLGLGLMVTMMSFKGTNDQQITVAAQWYTVSATSSSFDDQEIVSTLNEEPDTEQCNDLNSGLNCAVQINFTGATPSIGTISGRSVAQVLADYPGSSVLDDTKRP